MSAAWTRLRRLVASLMLVAAASLVLHGGAMAGLHGHGPGSAACDASHGHSHHATHEHGAGSHDFHRPAAAYHPADPGGDLRAASPTEAPEPDAAGLPCCASACAIALGSPEPAAAPASPARALAHAAAAQRGSGIDPNGLKRPPRPLGTA